MVRTEQHIKALRLFNQSREAGFKVTDEEETHLLECEDCQQALATFALLFGEPTIWPFGNQ